MSDFFDGNQPGDVEQPVSQTAPALDRVTEFRRVQLSNVEARVLGCLIEKSYLTPDVYPMTTNGLVTASNQKTNRDPVMSLTPVDVDSALLAMRQRKLVRMVHSQGSRATKHRQTLDEELAINEQQLVLLSVLMLRGPQTIGELRLRTERHDVGFDDLDAVESCLEAMARRTTPLVVQLERRPGHKEARWQHLLGDPDEVGESAPEEVTSSPAPSKAALAPQPVSAPGIGARVEELETQVANLSRQLASLAAKLGEPLE